MLSLMRQTNYWVQVLGCLTQSSCQVCVEISNGSYKRDLMDFRILSAQDGRFGWRPSVWHRLQHHKDRSHNRIFSIFLGKYTVLIKWFICIVCGSWENIPPLSLYLGVGVSSQIFLYRTMINFVWSSLCDVRPWRWMTTPPQLPSRFVPGVKHCLMLSKLFFCVQNTKLRLKYD